MDEMEIKQKVLKEIMGLMDEKEGEGLKMHPKIMAAKIEVEKPEEKELFEDKEDEGLVKESEDEIDPESMQKLLDMYKKMK